MHHLLIINNEIACFDVVEENRPQPEAFDDERTLISREKSGAGVFLISFYLSPISFPEIVPGEKFPRRIWCVRPRWYTHINGGSRLLQWARRQPEKENGWRTHAVRAAGGQAAPPAKIIPYSTLTHSLTCGIKSPQLSGNPRAASAAGEGAALFFSSRACIKIFALSCRPPTRESLRRGMLQVSPAISIRRWFTRRKLLIKAAVPQHPVWWVRCARGERAPPDLHANAPCGRRSAKVRANCAGERERERGTPGKLDADFRYLRLPLFEHEYVSSSKDPLWLYFLVFFTTSIALLKNKIGNRVLILTQKIFAKISSSFPVNRTIWKY
jgi:hypothetical protein